MRILIIGGTGRVGRAAARRLAGGGHDLRVMTRDPQKARSLPEGQRGVVGDLDDPASLAGPLEGVERVFMVTPLDQQETTLGTNGVAAAREAGVRRFIYMSVQAADAFPEIPHFASKVPVERAVAASGMEYTILRPNSFFQNDERLVDVIREHGVYPHPVGRIGLSAVDVADIGECAARALTGDGFAGRTINVVGPEVRTGEDNARTWAEVLGREVIYTGDDIEAWCAQLRKALPEWLARDICTMYRQFLARGFAATDQDRAGTRELLGRDGRKYEDWVRERVKGEG